MKSILKPDPSLELTRQERNKGFFFLFSNSKKLNPILFARLWLNLIYPEYARHPDLGKGATGLREYKSNSRVSAAGLEVFRKDSGFVLRLPIVVFSKSADSSSLAFLLSVSNKKQLAALENLSPYLDVTAFTGIKDHSDLMQDEVTKTLQKPSPRPVVFGEQPIPVTVNKTVSGVEAMEGLSLPVATKKALSSTIYQVEVTNTGAFIYVYINAREASYLVNKPKEQVRLLDLFNFAANWLEFDYGSNGHLPAEVSFSVSQIADSLINSPSFKKTNNYDLAVDIEGNLIYLPERNYANLYESRLLTECSVGDKLVGKSSIPSLSNKVVLTDWDNAKFVYTNVAGRLNVLDLHYHRPVNASHAINLGDTEVNETFITLIANLCNKFSYELEEVVLDSKDFPLGGDNSVSTRALQTYFTSLTKVNFLIEGLRSVVSSFYFRNLTFKDISAGSDFPLGRVLGKAIGDLYELAKDSIETLLPNNSIINVFSNFAKVILIAKYLNNYKEVKEQADVINYAALNQQEDPNYEDISLPFIKEGIGRLPHQYKIANITRHNPALTLYPVQAGGGKSLLTILDVLREIKLNTSKKFLVGCPDHLVSQYSKEIAFFTNNQVNALPLNTEIYNRHGDIRIYQMLKNAPLNTIVFVGLDFFKYGSYSINYGSANFVFYPIAEMLRGFKFDYCLIDESHYLKNFSSIRTKSVLSVITGIPRKKLASATMAFDSPSDLASQVAILDPTVFGSRDSFNERYAEKGKLSGGRVMEWKPTAQVDILERLKRNIVWASAMRREWAALLPPSEEMFIKTELTKNQMYVYEAILKLTLDEVKANATLMSRIKSSEDDDFDPEAGADLADLLRPFLARLEQYITAPGADPLGKLHLRGDDLISPKVKEIDKRIKAHWSNKIPGKILIFTNYVESAKAIYEGLSPEVREKTLLYKASEKAAMLARFKNNDDIQVMVGVEASMNTGLDIQFVSRLIRVETVWNPGTLEQGTSRINRPEVKASDNRERIYFDWILGNKTIDLTKISRLISKIVTVARFENANVQEYSKVPEVPVIKMTLDNIFSLNDWDNSLLEYANAYSQLRKVEQEDFRKFKEQFTAKYKGNFFFPIKVDKSIKGALMSHVPYARASDFSCAEALGLIRLDVYLDNIEGLNINLENTPVHTDFGDGRIVRINSASSTVRVKLKSLSKTFHITSVFVLTKRIPNPVRRAIVNAIGLPAVQTVYRDFKMPKPKAKPVDMRASLAVVRSNGFVGLKVSGSISSSAMSVLQNHGFVSTNSLLRLNLPKPSSLLKVLEELDSKDLTAARGTADDMTTIKTFLNGKLSVKHAKKLGMHNVHTMQFKGSGKSVHLYLNVNSKGLSVVLPNNSYTKDLLSSKLPWKQVPESLGWFTSSTREVKQMIKKLRRAGLQLNKELLQRTL